MIEWMAKGGSEHSKMRLRFYESTHRGVHAACNIKLGDIILKIPENNLIFFPGIPLLPPLTGMNAIFIIFGFLTFLFEQILSEGFH